jgi:vacuolar-type H+-ATPase subunit I/STV1
MEWVATVHSYWRWVVLLVGLASIVLSVISLTGNRPWDALSDRLAMYFTIAMDVQLLIGIIVWIVEQRWSGDLFLGYIHPLAMIGAVALAHVGRARADRATDSRDKGRQATIFFVASFVVILVAIPLAAWPI